MIFVAYTNIYIHGIEISISQFQSFSDFLLSKESSESKPIRNALKKMIF